MRISLFFLFLTHVFTQSDYRIQTIDMNDGLSSNAISAIFQDSKGYIWIGTKGSGLNMLDGYNVEKFFHSPFDSVSISNNYISRIDEDDAGNLYISTNSGFNKFDYKKRAFEHYMGNSKISEFSSQNNKDIFLATPNGLGILKNKKIFKYADLTELQNINIRTVNTLDSNTLFVGLNSGLTKIECDSNTLTKYRSNKHYFQYVRKSVLFGNKLYLAMHKGLLIFDTTTETFDELPTDQFEDEIIRNIHITNEFVYISLSKELISVNREYLENRSIAPNITYYNIQNTTCVFVDRNDIVWAGTSNSGIKKIIRKNNIFNIINVKNSDVDMISTSMIEYTNDVMWIATNLGIKLLSLKTGFIAEKHGSKYTYQISMDKNRTIWSWTRGTLEKLDERTNKFVKSRVLKNGNEKQFINVNFNHPDQIFAISENDIYLFNPQNDSFVKDKRFKQFPIQKTKINDFVIKDSIAWFATTDGLAKFSLSDKKTILIDFDSHMIRFFKLYIGGNNIWLTSNIGLFVYNIQENNFLHITEKNGLTNNSVKSIILYKKDAWIGTNYGLTKISLENTPKKYKSTRFYKSDGLSDNEFNSASYKTHNNKLIFSTKNGFTIVTPDSLNILKNNIKPAVTKIHYGNYYKFITDTSQQTFTYEENTIRFEFSSFDYSNSNKNQFAYKVDGLNSNWVPNGVLNSVQLANLSHGNYTFHLRSSDKSGQWSKQIYSLPFVIMPPFWKTWWFYLSILLVITSIIYYLYYVRKESHKKIEKLRLKIATDLHDDVGANLTKIALYSESMHKLSEKSVSPSQEKLNRVKELSRKSIDSMSDIVWAIDTRNNKVKDLINKMEDLFHDVNTKLNFTVDFKHSGLEFESSIPMDIRKNIFLITKEFVTNSIKYSKCDTIFVSILNVENFLLEIWDNGNAEPTEKKTGNGLRNMAMRAKEIGFDINISTENGYKLTLRGTHL